MTEAEAIFERFIGRRLSIERYEEHVKVEHNRCHVQHVPIVAIESIRATCARSNVVPWSLHTDLTKSATVEGTILSLPTTLFGESYTSAEVAYLAGLDPIPDDVIACIDEIERLLREKALDEWSGSNVLSEESQVTISRYRGGE